MKNSKLHFENHVKWISVCIFQIDLGATDYHLINNDQTSKNWTFKFIVLLQQARSRDLPSYTSSSLPPLTDGDGGGRDSLTSATSTIIHEKCCSRMAWREILWKENIFVGIYLFRLHVLKSISHNLLEINKSIKYYQTET